MPDELEFSSRQIFFSLTQKVDWFTGTCVCSRLRLTLVQCKMDASVNGEVNYDKEDEQEPLISVGNKSTHKSELHLHEHEEELPDGNTSVVGAAFIVGNAAIGGGLLAVPYAFYSAGGAIGGSLIEAVSSCECKNNAHITVVNGLLANWQLMPTSCVR